MEITISDGSTTRVITNTDIETVTFEASEFKSPAEATWYYVETDTEVLIADIAHMNDTDWQRLQTVADSNYYSQDATEY
jgi:hypothetical protein